MIYEILPSQEVYILKDTPYINYARDVLSKVGFDSTSYPTREYRSLIQFDISSLNNTERVRKAILKFNINRYSGDLTKQILVEILGQAFNQNTATWSSCSGLTISGQAGVITLTDGIFNVELDITSTVKNWVANSNNNFGLQLRVADGNNLYAEFYSVYNEINKPVLEIEYDDAGVNPAIDLKGVNIITKTLDCCTEKGLTSFEVDNKRSDEYVDDINHYQDIIGVVQLKETEEVLDGPIIEKFYNEQGRMVPVGQGTSFTTNAIGGEKVLAVIGSKTPMLYSYVLNDATGSYNVNENIIMKSTIEPLVRQINEPNFYTALNYEIQADSATKSVIDKNGKVTFSAAAGDGTNIIRYSVRGIETETLEFKNKVTTFASGNKVDIKDTLGADGLASVTNIVLEGSTTVDSQDSKAINITTKYSNIFEDTSASGSEVLQDTLIVTDQNIKGFTVKVVKNSGTEKSKLFTGDTTRFYLSEIMGSLENLEDKANDTDNIKVIFIAPTDSIMESFNLITFEVAGPKDTSTGRIKESGLKYLNQNPKVEISLVSVQA